MGLLRRTHPPPSVEARPKPFRIELGWRGMFGMVVVCFCLFLWMFLLGIWAGQTILLPPRTDRLAQGTESSPQLPAGAAISENGVSRRSPRTAAP